MPPSRSKSSALVEPVIAEAAAKPGAAMVAQMAKHLGKGYGGLISQGISVRIPGVISTQCCTLDAAIGRGGLPMSRLTILSGAESSGKTTLALHACAEVQRMGGVAYYVDNEHKLDTDYAAALGVNTDELLVGRPRYAEEMFFSLATFIALPGIGTPTCPAIMVLDSINSATPKADWEAGFEEISMGRQAAVFSKNLPKILGRMTGKHIVLLFISQERMKIGTVSYKDKVSGGSACKYYAALGIHITRDGGGDASMVKVGERAIGSKLVAECFKNQVARPHQRAKYNIIWGKGIDQEGALLERASSLGVLNVGEAGWGEITVPIRKPDGAVVDELIKWQGTNGFKKMIAARPGIEKYIKNQVAKRPLQTDFTKMLKGRVPASKATIEIEKPAE